MLGTVLKILNSRKEIGKITHGGTVRGYRGRSKVKIGSLEGCLHISVCEGDSGEQQIFAYTPHPHLVAEPLRSILQREGVMVS